MARFGQAKFTASQSLLRGAALRVGPVAVAVALAVAGACSGVAVMAQAPAAETPGGTPSEGRLYNLTGRPFVFQLHRADGVKWSGDYTVQPGKFFAVQALRANDKSEILGISGNGRGFVVVRYREPKLGGFMTLRLPAENPANQKLQPTWFAVEDSSGLTRLVQEGSIEDAQAVQENLKKQPAMTAAELERMRHVLRSNWVLTN